MSVMDQVTFLKWHTFLHQNHGDNRAAVAPSEIDCAAAPKGHGYAAACGCGSLRSHTPFQEVLPDKGYSRLIAVYIMQVQRGKVGLIFSSKL